MNYLIDLDNTLIDENEYLFEAYAEIANAYKFDVNEMIEVYLNEGRQWLFDKMIGRHGGNVKDYLRILRSASLEYELEVYPEMMDLLKSITKKGRVFVVTNGNVIQQINKVRQTNWQGLKDKLIFIYANKIFPKPDKRLFLYLKDKYNLRESECLVIGDSETDKQFAINSNIKFQSYEKRI